MQNQNCNRNTCTETTKLEYKINKNIDTVTLINDDLKNMLTSYLDGTAQIDTSNILSVKNMLHRQKKCLIECDMKFKIYSKLLCNAYNNSHYSSLKHKINNELVRIKDCLESVIILQHSFKDVMTKKIIDNMLNNTTIDLTIGFDDNDVTFSGYISNNQINLCTKTVTDITFNDIVGKFKLLNYPISHGALTIFDTKTIYSYTGIILKLNDEYKYIISTRPLIPLKYMLQVIITIQLYLI